MKEAEIPVATEDLRGLRMDLFIGLEKILRSHLQEGLISINTSRQVRIEIEAAIESALQKRGLPRL